jgi:hypothetical protein
MKGSQVLADTLDLAKNGSKILRAFHSNHPCLRYGNWLLQPATVGRHPKKDAQGLSAELVY